MKRVLVALSFLLLVVVALRAAMHLRAQEPLPILGSCPEFELTNQKNEAFSARDLAGKPWIASFIYSTCPGPCPRVVEALAAADRRLSHDPRIRLVSFSVDPEADTPEVLAIYGRNRGIDPERWMLLTGDAETVFGVVRGGFKLGVERNAGPDIQKLGAVIHSTHAALVDPALRIRGYYETTDADAMKRLVRDARRLADENVR